MFILGHLGFGSLICRPWMKSRSKRAFLLGALLPDLIDKTTYYGLSWSTGLRGAELPTIHGTRSLGHTLVFLLFCSLFASFTRKRATWVATIALGISSHLILDLLTDQWIGLPKLTGLDHLPLLWPWSGEFPTSPHPSLTQHLWSAKNPFFIVTEILGGLIVLTDQRLTANK